MSELKEVEGVGEVVSEELSRWLQNKDNKQFIEKLLKLGVEVISPRRLGIKLKGKTFVLTGTLQKLTRDESEEKIRALGGSISSSVSSSTDYVVAGENPGSKHEKARKLDVKIVSEKEFLNMIE